MASEIVVGSAEQPKKIDNFLKKRFPVGYVRKLFRKGAVRLNGKRCGPNEVAAPGDRVTLFIPFHKEPPKIPARPPRAYPSHSAYRAYRVVFEDDEMLVIDKEPGTATHEGKGVLKRHSILGIVEAAYRDQGIKPRLVHRLDRDTSGLLVVAKSEAAGQELERQFAESGVEKHYLVLVFGEPAPKKGRIDFSLPGREGGAVPATTHYQVKRKFGATTLVDVQTETGRMHQIRLHFARLGHPVVMDDQHGNFALNKDFRRRYGLKRQFLHAWKMALEYRGKLHRWTAPLPDDLTRTLDALAAGR